MNLNDLKEIRKNLGVTQMGLAKKVGVSLLTIQLWEHGISLPSPQNQEKLEEVLKELESEKKEVD
jgi:transcriptional regulator with XRE-family HTH domain